MITSRTIGRIGILATGLGIGAALATGTATADTSSDWASSIDNLLAGALPAATSPTDFQISFNGMDLFPTAGNEASAYTVEGQYGLAIAYGDGATASAEGGTGDFALASGTDAHAYAGSVALDGTGNNYDTAVDIGNNATGFSLEGAFAGNSSVTNEIDSPTAASHDSAYDFGNNNGSNDGAFATEGNSNSASDSGNNTGAYEGAQAEAGNNNSAIVDTNYSTDSAYTFAGNGDGNYASVYGPENSSAFAEDGNSNVAYVNDPFGMAGTPDSALAGYSANSDLAEVLFTHGDASASGGNFLYDVISLFGTYMTPP